MPKSDAPQNMGQFRVWNDTKAGGLLKDFELEAINRKWRSLGKLVKQPASLRGVQRI
jgi:hypothetical protein